METIANRFKRLREERGFTIREVASRLGVPITTYREWEYGRSIRGEPYSKLAEVLEVSLSELLTGEKVEKVKLLQTLDEIDSSLRGLRENSKVITVSTSPAEGATKTVVGAVSGSTFTGRMDPAITIKANPKQKVLPVDPTNPLPFLIGPGFIEIDATGGTYRSNAGNEKPIHIRNSAVNPVLIFGGVGGKIVQVY